MNSKIGPGDMCKALNVNRNMEKMFLPWLEEGSGGCEVRRALTPIHLSPFISLLLSLTSSPSPHLPHETHTHTLKMIHPHTYAYVDVEKVDGYSDGRRMKSIHVRSHPIVWLV